MIKLAAITFMAIIGVWMMIHGNDKLRYRDFPEASLALMVGGCLIAVIAAGVGGITVGELLLP